MLPEQTEIIALPVLHFWPNNCLTRTFLITWPPHPTKNQFCQTMWLPMAMVICELAVEKCQHFHFIANKVQLQLAITHCLLWNRASANINQLFWTMQSPFYISYLYRESSQNLRGGFFAKWSGTPKLFCSYFKWKCNKNSSKNPDKHATETWSFD